MMRVNAGINAGDKNLSSFTEIPSCPVESLFLRDFIILVVSPCVSKSKSNVVCIVLLRNKVNGFLLFVLIDKARL